jgi:hypothetical protein
LAALFQIFLLFAVYLRKGFGTGMGAGSFSFAAIHTVKQIAQLLGTLVGTFRLLKN